MIKVLHYCANLMGTLIRLNLLTLVNALGLIDIKQRFDLFIDYAFNKYIHLMILNNIK